ncbi:MAG: ABC transporter permease [Alphaproteobacteria bacterium]
MNKPDYARVFRAILPALSLAIILIAIFSLNERAMSYNGMRLLLKLSVPIVLATIAQMLILCVNELDLSIGNFVGLTACITATWLNDTPLLGVLALGACIAAYAGVGALIHLRKLPSIVVTLGMSFVWLGLAVLLLPAPGGKSPGWISAMMNAKPALVPMPIIMSIFIAVAAHMFLMRSSYGAVLRGAGGNATAVARAGWSLLRVKVTMFALAGFFGVLSGMALVGLTTAADANIATRYTLLSIAGAILGGSQFVGGRVSPIGAVIGALTLTLTTPFLTFLRLNPDFQIGAQGAILILVLALRAIINRAEART